MTEPLIVIDKLRKVYTRGRFSRATLSIRQSRSNWAVLLLLGRPEVSEKG